MISLLREVEPLHQSEVVEHRTHPPKLRLWRDARFYLLLPGNLFLGLVLTALFLYQVPLAESRGWSAGTMATAFVGFALARVVASLTVGPLIDRWGAVRLFPMILLPACIGLGILSVGTAPATVFVYLALVGVSQGIASPMMTALWAEVYGVETLGATKSTVAMLGIFATALGPLLLGALLKAGVTFHVIIPAAAILGVAVVGVSFIARARLSERSTAHSANIET